MFIEVRRLKCPKMSLEAYNAAAGAARATSGDHVLEISLVESSNESNVCHHELRSFCSAGDGLGV